MMKKKILITLLIILGILFIGLAFITVDGKNYKNFSQEEKLEDFDYLWGELKRSYPFFGVAERSGIDIDTVYATCKENIINSRSDTEFVRELSYFLKDLGGNGHLSVVNPTFYNNVVIPTNIEAKKTLVDAKYQKMIPWIETSSDPSVQEAYSYFVPYKERFTVNKYMKKDNKDDVSIDDPTIEENISFEIIRQDEIAYMRIDFFDFNALKSEKETLYNFYKEIEEYPNLIIDIRENRGGSDLYWKNLIVAPNINHELAYNRFSMFKLSDVNKPYIDAKADQYHVAPIEQLSIRTDVNENDMNEMSHYLMERSNVLPESKSKLFGGKIWVLTSEKVYSSSENFVMFCKNTGFATLVGTTTGGDGGTMDPVYFTLPNTGLLVRYSMLLGLNSDGSSNEEFGTTPDFMTSTSAEALDKCIELIDME